MRILLVEDEALDADAIVTLLRNLGYDVVGVAESGSEALRIASATQPDLVLMDIRLRGELDGVATAQRLHAASGTPIVYVTGYADEETLAHANTSRPHGYLVKPFERRQLRAAIEIAIHQKKLDEQLRAAEARYRERFEVSPAGIFSAALDGTIAECNAAFATTLGYATREQLVGQPISDRLVEPAEWGRLVVGLGIVGTATNLELRFRRRDGTVAWTLTNATRVGEGAAERIEGQIHDVTEHRRTEEINRAREALRATVALATATAHEIFNPLTALYGRLELLANECADPDQHRQIAGALDSAQTIRDIVHRMINITQLEFDRPAGEPDAMLDIRRSSEPGDRRRPSP